jgi:DNA polymerase-1
MAKRVLIVDMLNLFYRSYVVDPSLTLKGVPIGGLKGAIKALQKLSKEVYPDEFILCWDGDGGSAKRKQINKNYKEGRKPLRLNRVAHVFTEDQELQNKIWQQTRLIEYLNEMPVIQFKFQGTEADDVIAHIVHHPFYDGWQKVIASNDKDFYQLCSSETLVYRLLNRKDENGKKLPNEIVTSKSLLEDHSIHPNNFALARALAGDKSDNLEGVGGVGLKTAAKRFPMLRDEQRHTITELIDHCKEHVKNNKKSLKAYQNVISNSEILERNYKMMQLYIPSLGLNAKEQITNALNNIEFTFSKTELLKMMIGDGFGELNLMNLFTNFNKIVIDQDLRIDNDKE